MPGLSFLKQSLLALDSTSRWELLALSWVKATEHGLRISSGNNSTCVLVTIITQELMNNFVFADWSRREEFSSQILVLSETSTCNCSHVPPVVDMGRPKAERTLMAFSSLTLGSQGCFPALVTLGIPRLAVLVQSFCHSQLKKKSDEYHYRVSWRCGLVGRVLAWLARSPGFDYQPHIN